MKEIPEVDSALIVWDSGKASIIKNISASARLLERGGFTNNKMREGVGGGVGGGWGAS